MVSRLLIFLFFLEITSILDAQESPNKTFEKAGEVLKYSIKYGLLKVGDAEIFIDPELAEIDEENHHSIQFRLTSVGWLRFFANVDLCMDSYLNADNFQSKKANRSLSAGNKYGYQRDEYLYNDSIYVKTTKEHRGVEREYVFTKTDRQLVDALGAYLWILNQDFDQVNGKLELGVFFGNKVYDFALSPAKYSSSSTKKYSINFPDVKEFPRRKESYVILSKESNLILEMKVASHRGNFYFIYETAKN